MKALTMLSDTPPHFASKLPVGQLYFPKWDRYETAMRGIFERQYYNNNGPLHQELEMRLREFFGVQHVICTGNATFGLMMVAEALGLTGRVLMPSFTFIASAQSLSWCGLIPVFCDIDPQTHQLDPEKVAELLAREKDISAIMAVNLWGGACDMTALEQIAERHNIPVYFDSSHAFGCSVNKRPVGSFGVAEVFSFHATKVFSAAEGGCVTTNDDALAARIRGIRPSYGSEQSAEAYRVLNARMSEAQAAIGLMSLEDYPDIQKRNKSIFDVYMSELSKLGGIRLMLPSNVTASNHQYAVCEVDADIFGLSRDDLISVLQAENVLARRYFYPATHRSAGFDENAEKVAASLPVTEAVCGKCLQLPLGAKTAKEDAHAICEIIAQAQSAAPEIRQNLHGRA